MSNSSALVTVLFTDIVGSTVIADEMGDRRWRELLARHHRIVRTELRRFGGREIDTAGDGFFASFDRPAQAIRCAASIVDAVRPLGIEIRAGVHVGEAEVMGRGLGGVAVHTGARIAAQAGPGEVLVSGTLRDLVPGATFAFDDRGVRELKGVRAPPRLFLVREVDEKPLPPSTDPDEARARREAIAPRPVYRRRGVRVAALVTALLVVGVLVFVFTRSDPPEPVAPARDVAVLVDPVSGEIRSTVDIPPGPSIVYGFIQARVGEGGLWIVHGNCVCRVEAETREVGQVDLTEIGFAPSELALGHGAAWVATLGGSTFSVNPTDLAASDPLSVPASETFLTSITTTEDAVWAMTSRRLTRIDPRDGTISEPITLNHGADDITGAGTDVWVIDRLANTLHRYNDDGEHIDSVELQVTPDELAPGPDGSLWVLNRSGGTVTRVDQSGQAGDPIRVGADSSDIAVGPDAVWVADHAGRTIQRIDPGTEQRDDPIRLPGPVVAIDVDQNTGLVWAYLA
jgi:class 3 adenylate cyclase/streptogramin lyase